MLGISGLMCHILFEMNTLINQNKAVNISTYLKKKKYGIALTFVLIIQASYFRDLYLNLINHSWNFSQYSLIAYWIAGFFANNIITKIHSIGSKHFETDKEKKN
jgi:hypothetical protein